MKILMMVALLSLSSMTAKAANLAMLSLNSEIMTFVLQHSKVRELIANQKSQSLLGISFSGISGPGDDTSYSRISYQLDFGNVFRSVRCTTRATVYFQVTADGQVELANLEIESAPMCRDLE